MFARHPTERCLQLRFSPGCGIEKRGFRDQFSDLSSRPRSVLGLREELAEVGQLGLVQRQEPAREAVDQPEELAERLDPRLEIVQLRVGLGELEDAVEDRQGGVELAPLPLLEDPPEEGPDVGLGPEELARSPGRWSLRTTPQASSSLRFMLTLPRETRSQSLSSSAVQSVPVM